ncbi:hydroxymethylglutaryl-CoA lyase [Alcanivorax quisquiliarum]|nr:hydroxymethylglutaryl-CoA lyase [Alcanivorax quisquiliarum]
MTTAPLSSDSVASAGMIAPARPAFSSDSVRLVEVGPRDGLQNEKSYPATDVKIELITRLAAAGMATIEAGSFVSPRRVPAMADTGDVMRRLPIMPDVSLPVLVPNMRGLEQAMLAGCREIAVFLSASEGFSQRNIQCSIQESRARYIDVIDAALVAGLRVRGYISCVVRCPYDGDVPIDKVVQVAQWLLERGCYEVSLGDTIGAGTPAHIRALLQACAATMPVTQLAGHFHDTYGMAVANVVAALESGVRVFDTSVAGLGGCPYAKGASGNVASEDVVYLLRGLGMQTGVDLPALVETGAFISQALGRATASAVGRALS